MIGSHDLKSKYAAHLKQSRLESRIRQFKIIKNWFKNRIAGNYADYCFSQRIENTLGQS